MNHISKRMVCIMRQMREEGSQDCDIAAACKVREATVLKYIGRKSHDAMGVALCGGNPCEGCEKDKSCGHYLSCGAYQFYLARRWRWISAKELKYRAYLRRMIRQSTWK